jgi:hypothetical protein
MLNKDQQQALDEALFFYYSQEKNFVITGRGGTGKSYLLNSIIEKLEDVKMLFLASTNEALEQFMDKVDNADNYVFKTVHSSLGIVPTDNGEELSFEHKSIPNFWNDFQLAIIDEAGMLDDNVIDILLSINIKIIWVGDGGQHAPVKKNISIKDKCVSPVFLKGWNTVTLKMPMRNQGAITEFCNIVADNAETASRTVPKTFDVNKKELLEYVDNNLAEFHNGNAKIIAYSNETVRKYNDFIRLKLFGEISKTNRFLETDKIILTKPLNVVQELDSLTDKDLRRLKYEDLTVLYANTKLTVINCQNVVVTLNQKISVSCFKLKVKDNKDRVFSIFCLENEKDINIIGDYYKHLAWGVKDRKDQARMFKSRRLILCCFAEILHYYAATSHRVQGASIDTVIPIYGDMLKINNIYLQNKAINVAVGRAKKRILFFRGLL